MSLAGTTVSVEFKRRVTWLGYLGVLPLLTATLLTTLNWQHELAVDFVKNYSAVVLTFIGAIHWGRAIDSQQNGLVTFSVLPSLMASACLMLSAVVALPLLAIGFVLLLLVDYQLFTSVDWFRLLRLRLTLVVVSLIVVSWMGGMLLLAG